MNRHRAFCSYNLTLSSRATHVVAEKIKKVPIGFTKVFERNREPLALFFSDIHCDCKELALMTVLRVAETHCTRNDERLICPDWIGEASGMTSQSKPFVTGLCCTHFKYTAAQSPSRNFGLLAGMARSIGSGGFTLPAIFPLLHGLNNTTLPVFLTPASSPLCNDNHNCCKWLKGVADIVAINIVINVCHFYAP